jgi:hypothetical protein
MGGWNSGRPATKVTVESGLMLDLGRLMRQGLVRPNGYRSGSIIWTYAETRKERASIGYEADFAAPEQASMRLYYAVNGTPKDYRITMHRTPCRFGGFRWWWVCPRTGHLAAKLYLPPGATMFASRRAYRMAYRSELGGPMDRSHLRQGRIYEKLGETYGFYEQSPPRRPKGMHRRTYERLVNQLYGAMDVHEQIFDVGSARIMARLFALDARRR